MKLYVDISQMTECELEERPYMRLMPDRIPVQLGRHSLDLDAIETEIDEDKLMQARQMVRDRMIEDGIAVTLDDLRPIGCNMPFTSGANLILVDGHMEVEVELKGRPKECKHNR